MSGRRAWTPVLVAALAVIAISGLGALSTDLGPWYRGLQQPPWKPPDWLFGPAWTLIYVSTALAGVRAWNAAPGRGAERKWILAAFALNASLNLLWSLLFFRWQRPDWALLEVGFLWASIVLLMRVLARSDRFAAVLLSPYLAWVSFAAALNFAVVRLNAPFGAG